MTSSEVRKNADAKEARRETSRERLTEIYAGMIGSIGLTGREIARLSGTRPQYISDIKRRQRPLSREMFMRTLTGLYGEYKWLISGDLVLDTQRIISLYPHLANPDGATLPLPVLQRPFFGPKMMAADWDGTFVCVTTPVKEMAKAMRDPYILHLPFDDNAGRLRKGDYLLVDQKDAPGAAYVLLKSGWGVKLVRKTGSTFEDAETGERRFDGDAQVIGNIALLVQGKL